MQSAFFKYIFTVVLISKKTELKKRLAQLILNCIMIGVAANHFRPCFTILGKRNLKLAVMILDKHVKRPRWNMDSKSPIQPVSCIAVFLALGDAAFYYEKVFVKSVEYAQHALNASIWHVKGHHLFMAGRVPN